MSRVGAFGMGGGFSGYSGGAAFFGQSGASGFSGTQGYSGYSGISGISTSLKATFTSPVGSLGIGANSVRDISLTGFCNRGFVHYFLVNDLLVAANPYDIELYAESSFTTLLYKVSNIDPASAFEDYLPFWVEDAGEDETIHMRITNHHPTLSGSLIVTIGYERLN